MTEWTPDALVSPKGGPQAREGLDEQRAERGVEVITPHRATPKPENVTQARRPLLRHWRRQTIAHGIA